MPTYPNIEDYYALLAELIEAGGSTTRAVSLFTIFDRVTDEIFTVIDHDFQGL